MIRNFYNDPAIDELQSIIDGLNLDETDPGCLEYLKENDEGEVSELDRLSLIIEYWEMVLNVDLKHISIYDEYGQEDR